MEAEASSPMSPSSLKQRLRTTVCCCFGGGSGASAGRARWRRRVAGGDFGYDPLSYALNFDEGGDDEYGDAAAAFQYKNFSSRLPPSPSPRSTVISIA